MLLHFSTSPRYIMVLLLHMCLGEMGGKTLAASPGRSSDSLDKGGGKSPWCLLRLSSQVTFGCYAAVACGGRCGRCGCCGRCGRCGVITPSVIAMSK